MVLLSVGLNVFPAFLDYKMRTTPFHIPASYYNLNDNSKSFPPEMQGIANRGLILRQTLDDEEEDEEMANLMPEPKDDHNNQRNKLDTFEDEYIGNDDQDEQEDKVDPNHPDNAIQGQSQGSDSVDPPTDPMVGNEPEDDESEQPFDSDSDPAIPARRSSQMHPLAPTGFFGEEEKELDSWFEETNFAIEEEHGDTGDVMEGSDDDAIDALFREKANDRSSDATEMVSNQMDNFEAYPMDSFEDEHEV